MSDRFVVRSITGWSILLGGTNQRSSLSTSYWVLDTVTHRNVSGSAYYSGARGRYGNLRRGGPRQKYAEMLAARLNREAEALERGEPLPRGTGPVLRRWAL